MFIELTDSQTNEKKLFNKIQIVSVSQCENSTVIDTIMNNYGLAYYVAEDYEEVKGKLTNDCVYVR